jgi:pyruvate kinase
MAAFSNAWWRMEVCLAPEKHQHSGVRICLPSLTEKDRRFIRMAVENDVDFIAHSFVRTKQDVIDVQTLLDESRVR